MAEIVKAGSLGEGNVPMDSVKEIIIKDLEIFLDESILPDIDKKLNPPEEKAEDTEEQAEDGESAETKEEADE